jgi:hypothetical protein
MMQNVETPVPADQWGSVTEYLIKSFPERPRPAAVVLSGPVEAVLKEWPVPTGAARRAASDFRRRLRQGRSMEGGMKKAAAPARIVAVPRSAERLRLEHLDEPHL